MICNHTTCFFCQQELQLGWAFDDVVMRHIPVEKASQSQGSPLETLRLEEFEQSQGLPTAPLISGLRNSPRILEQGKWQLSGAFEKATEQQLQVGGCE